LLSALWFAREVEPLRPHCVPLTFALGVLFLAFVGQRADEMPDGGAQLVFRIERHRTVEPVQDMRDGLQRVALDESRSPADVLADEAAVVSPYRVGGHVVLILEANVVVRTALASLSARSVSARFRVRSHGAVIAVIV
jgi:hypothetical protein